MGWKFLDQCSAKSVQLGPNKLFAESKVSQLIFQLKDVFFSLVLKKDEFEL